LYPGKKPEILDIRITDDRFVMAINVDKNKKSAADIEKALKDSGAVEVNVK
jgi:predicted TIM-barrel fold metal-dependent hydrolase